MALPSPVAAIPDLGARMQQLQDRAKSAWGKVGQGNLADNMEAWNGPATAPTQSTGPGGPGSAAGAYGAANGAGGGMTGSAAQNAYNNRLRELGVPEHVIEGNAWNVHDESGWNPTIGGDNGMSFGLNQWYGPRKEALMKHAQELGMDPGDPVFQANNWFREMQSDYRGAYDKAVASGTPWGAADVILRDFERPAAVHLNRRSADYLGRGSAGYAQPIARYGQ